MGLTGGNMMADRWRAWVILQHLRLRYWYLDTETGLAARMWLMVAALLVVVVQVARMSLEEAQPEPTKALAWWVVQLIIAVVSALISYALRPKVEAPKPAEADMPTTEDGRAVPEAHGTVWIEDEFMLAYKVVDRVPIKSGGKK